MTETTSRHRTFPLYKLTLSLLGIAVTLTAFTLYLQTRHAFHHIILPLMATAVPGELQIDDGSLTLPATLKLTGLSYQQSDKSLSLQISQLTLQISVMAWLREHLLLVEELDLKNGTLHINSRATQPPQESETTGTTVKKITLLVPLAVQRARLENITLSIQTGSTDLTLRDMTVAINNVGPGRTGTMNFNSEMALTRAANQSRWAGTLLLTGTLEESPGGQQLTWNVSHKLTVQEWPGHEALAESGVVVLDQTLSGHYDFTQATLRADSSLILRQGTTSLANASFQFTRTKSPDGTVMDMGMKIQEVSDAAINLMLGHDESLRLRSAHMSGDVNIHARGERYDVRSTFTGQKLQAVSGENTTPPLDIDVAQAGIIDIASRNVTLDIVELRVAEGDHVRLAGELKHSVTISFGNDDMTRTGVSAQNAPQADWMLTVNDIGVAELRQWGDAFGWKGLRGIRTGQLGGIVTASIHDKGTAIDLNTRLTISNMRMTSSDKSTDRAPLKFTHDIHSTITNLTLLHLHSWIMTASVHDRSVGIVRLSGAMNLSAPLRDPRLEGSLTLTDLPGEACNPLLALWSDAGIDRAFFNGTAEIKTTGDLISWKIDLRGNRLSLRLPKMNQATAPLDLVVAQSGSFDRTTGVLRLDKMLLQEFEQSRSVIIAALDKPVHFVVSSKEGDEKTRQSTDREVATFTLEVHHAGIDQLRPRLAIWNVSALDSVKTGVIDGRWTIQGQRGTSTLSVTGTLDITDLRLDTGAIHISAPLVMRSRINASITEFSRIQLEALSLKALAGTMLIAEAGLTGQMTVEDGSTDLALTFNTDNMATLFDRIGLLDVQQRTLFTGGSVSADGHLTGRGQQHPVSAEATIRAREFRFQPIQGRFLTYSFLTQGTAELNAARTGIEFNRIGMTLESRGKTAGTLTLAGTWPIASPEQNGAMTVVTKDLDAAPLADLFGLFPGRAQGPLPVNADVAITQNAASGILTVRGQEILGPIRLARTAKNGGSNEATLHLTHDVSRHHDEIHAAALTVTAERPAGRSDRVTASGSMKIAGPPGAQLRGEIASLDAGWYAALFSGPEPNPQTNTNQAAVKNRASRPEESNTLALLTNLDAELSIGSISYHTLMIGPGRVIAKGTGAQLEVKLEQTGIAEGHVEAIVTLARQNNQAQLTWSGKGQGLSLGTIMQAVEPGLEPRLKGTGSFMTSGAGLLNEEPFRNHASGIFNFNIADGQFRRAPMLHFLAQYTHIRELEQMGFTGLHGKVRLENQWIHAESISATGTLASLDGNASVSPDDTVDGRIFVKIGPSLGKKIKIPCMSALLRTTDGFTALPFAVRIKGSTEHLTFSADTEA